MGVICCSRIREGLPHAQAWFFIGSRAGVVLIGRRVWSGLISVGFPPRKRGANLDCEISLTFQELQIRVERTSKQSLRLPSFSLLPPLPPTSQRPESPYGCHHFFLSLNLFHWFVASNLLLINISMFFVPFSFCPLDLYIPFSILFLPSLLLLVWPHPPPRWWVSFYSTMMVSLYLFHHDGESRCLLPPTVAMFPPSPWFFRLLY